MSNGDREDMTGYSETVTRLEKTESKRWVDKEKIEATEEPEPSFRRNEAGFWKLGMSLLERRELA